MPVTTGNIHHGQGRQVDMANSDAKPCNPDGSVVDNLLPGDACGVHGHLPRCPSAKTCHRQWARPIQIMIAVRGLINFPGKHTLW